MELRLARDPTIVVSTADPELLDQALSVVAAAGLEAEVTSDPGSLRSRWASASMLVIGVDQAAAVAGLRLGRRAEVYLLAETGSATEAYQWSMPLGAAVVVVPGNVRWLSGAVADLRRRPSGSGRLLCVTGVSGGVGVSTLAAALAFASAREGGPSVLVDLDVGGGGLDLLVGAEQLDGWRWPRLTHARGHLGELGDQLPDLDGVGVLSMARDGKARPPEPDALGAVLTALTVGHDLCVVDVPRQLEDPLVDRLAEADAWLLVVRDDLRGVAAGRDRVQRLAAVGVRPELVVRTGRTRLLDSENVAEGVGLDLAGVLADEPGLALAADRGDPPGRSARSPLGQLARRLLDRPARTEARLAEVTA